MSRKSFEAVKKAKRQEANARAARRRAEALEAEEYADALAKHFPVLGETKVVNGEEVPKVDDVDAFVKHLAALYAAEQKGAPAPKPATEGKPVLKPTDGKGESSTATQKRVPTVFAGLGSDKHGM